MVPWMRLGWEMDEVGVMGGGGAPMALDGHHDGRVLIVPVGWSSVWLDSMLGGLVDMLAFNMNSVQYFCQKYP